jgi:hypothetical protein
MILPLKWRFRARCSASSWATAARASTSVSVSSGTMYFVGKLIVVVVVVGSFKGNGDNEMGGKSAEAEIKCFMGVVTLAAFTTTAFHFRTACSTFAGVRPVRNQMYSRSRLASSR